MLFRFGSLTKVFYSGQSPTQIYGHTREHVIDGSGRQTKAPGFRLTSMIRRLSSARALQFALAPILSLWIAGAGCVMGCEGMVAAAANALNSASTQHSDHLSAQKTVIVASGHACSSGGSHSCCSKRAGESQPRAQQNDIATSPVAVGVSPSGSIKVCPLSVGKAAIAAKIRNNETAGPVVENSIPPSENFLEQTGSLSTPPRLPNRGHTYLRCCVFLI